MAVYVTDDGRLLRRALFASLGLHALFALLLPTWIRGQSQELQPIESLSFAHLVRLQIARPVVHAPQHIQVQTSKRAQVPTFAHVKTELSASSKNRRPVPKPIAGAPGLVAAAPKPVIAKQPAPLYARTSATTEPVAAVQNARPSTPQPATDQGERSVTGANTDRGGVMPLGAAQDPVLDPRVLATLQQRIGVHVTLTVRVGEDGRTERVDFNPPLDAQLERSIEEILAQADWDAAICGGGVSCEGTATIRL